MSGPALRAAIAACSVVIAAPAAAQPMATEMPGMTMPQAEAAPAPPAVPGMGDTAGMDMQGMLGRYPMTRESSGTAWQPDSSPMRGYMFDAGGWSLMGEGYLTGIYDDQGGPRGGAKTFSNSMAMLMASRDVSAQDRIGLRAMLSLDPAMGPSGYPLLFATGENRERAHAAGRSPAPARSGDGARRQLEPRSGRGQGAVALRWLARRARARAAHLHAPHLGHGRSGSADRAPLVRFHAHHLRRRHRRLLDPPVEGRDQRLQGPRARPASLESRDAQTGQLVGARVLEPRHGPVLPAFRPGTSIRPSSSSPIRTSSARPHRLPGTSRSGPRATG